MTPPHGVLLLFKKLLNEDVGGQRLLNAEQLIEEQCDRVELETSRVFFHKNGPVPRIH